MSASMMRVLDRASLSFFAILAVTPVLAFAALGMIR